MGRQRFEALDGMRGVAALSVVIFHCDLVTGVQLLPGAVVAVDIFFVLSGFVIGLSYDERLRDGLSPFRFLRVRARRLLPAHLWAICILLPVTLVHNADTELSSFSGRAIFIVALMNAFFIPYRTGALGMAFPINPALWSLWDEWVTNIVYAAGMFSMRSRAITVASAVSLGFALWFGWKFGRWNVGPWYISLLPSIFRALGEFTAGLLIYRAHKLGWLKNLPQVQPLWIYAGWLVVWANPQTEARLAYELTAAIVGAPLAIALLVRAERPVGPIFRWLGAVSYPLYVSHLAVLLLVGRAVRHFGLGQSALFAIPVAVLALALALAQVVIRLSELRLPPAFSRFAVGKEAD